MYIKHFLRIIFIILEELTALYTKHNKYVDFRLYIRINREQYFIYLNGVTDPRIMHISAKKSVWDLFGN